MSEEINLKEILRLHQLWLCDDKAGKRADLREANLRGANLCLADLPDYIICPQDGEFIAWKKLSNNILAKIKIHEDSKRICNLISRKIRTNKLTILEMYDEKGNAINEKVKCWSDEFKFYYETGKTYEQEVNEDIRIDCATGLHFFLTRKEAEKW